MQPFLAGAVAFLAFPLLMLTGNTGPTGGTVDVSGAAVAIAAGAALVTVVISALVIPVALWVLRRHQLTLVGTLLFGLAFGNLPYVLLALAAGGTYGLSGLVSGLAFSSLLGLTGAAAFWVIAVRRTARAAQNR